MRKISTCGLGAFLVVLALTQIETCHARTKSHPPPAAAPGEQGKVAPPESPQRPSNELAVGLKGHLSPVWTATYECRSKKATGCSAGCASASFSPVQRLIVVLGSVTIGSQTLPVYYYLAEFPQSSSKSATSVAKAEGFILNTNAVCGTVNMDLTFSGPGN